MKTYNKMTVFDDLNCWAEAYFSVFNPLNGREKVQKKYESILVVWGTGDKSKNFHF